MRNILLIEPPYKTKYPPLGLMKISTYHKFIGDNVYFYKGLSKELKGKCWDRIYISTLFTYYWKETIRAFEYYKDSTRSGSHKDIYLGGVTATLLQEELQESTGATVIEGLLNKSGKLDKNSRLIVDELVPDYSLIEESEHKYSHTDSYLAYATRGCPHRCEFCAVNQLEPDYKHYLPLKKQIMLVEQIYGAKQNLILMDNNVLASENFEKIINDICDLGFHAGAKFNNKKKIVDFNQGTDARLLDKKKMELLSKIAIKPLRIAFDHISMKDLYIDKIRLACDAGVLNLSNYVLYNHKDKPNDFYERLRINVLLNEEIGTKIYSFPMKFIPLNAKDRSFVGENWNKKLLRGIQCVLIVTRGLVSPRLEFFEAAFGSDYDEFLKIMLMPERYIINRRKHEANGAFDWSSWYGQLTNNEMNIFVNKISENKDFKGKYTRTRNKKIKNLLDHYIN